MIVRGHGKGLFIDGIHPKCLFLPEEEKVKQFLTSQLKAGFTIEEFFIDQPFNSKIKEVKSFQTEMKLDSGDMASNTMESLVTANYN